MEQFVDNMTGFIQGLPVFATIAFLFLSAVLQQVFPPYPGDSVNLFSGYLCGMDSMHPVLAFVSFYCGTVISSLLLYELGRRYGHKVLNMKLVKNMTEQKRERMLMLFHRYGVFYLMACKFLPGLNSVALILSGVCGLTKRVAYPGICAVAAIHNLFFFYAGRTVGVNWNDVERFVYSVNKYAIFIIGGVVALLALFLYSRNIMRKRKEAREDSQQSKPL